ncbi:MAG: polymerase alpha subunit, partial [Candidatus Hydrogenedentota bacterium]
VDIFGKDHLFLEVSQHGTPEDAQLNEAMAKLAADFGVGLVATNQCYYLDASEAEAYDALTCLRDSEKIDNPDRPRLPNRTYCFRSAAEMREVLADYPEALDATLMIAERCNVEIPLQQNLIPAYVVPEGYDPAGYLRELVMSGLKERYSPLPDAYVDRANFELSVIEKMRFVDYFLVVWDLIHHARLNNIPVGPGRGSGAGSIVAYALHITNIDPMRYQLLFERFLNPDRVSMPDFDIDFCFEKRGKMIEYAYEKYGRDNVSQIITFGRMLAKNVVRSVGRVLGMPYGEVDRIAKLVPDDIKIKLKEALEKEPELKRMVEQDAQISRLWRLAERLEGTIFNCGTHAAGVVICDHPLTDHVGLFKAEGSDTVATQVEMKCVEEVGLLKMDFLGLRTLTVVHDAVRMIREGRGIDIDIDHLEPNDAAAYALLRSGQTTGVFQLESSGMRELAKRIGLESLEEMSALVALYRPGPMQFIDTYIANKFNPEAIPYDHPLLEPILKETYGIAVYQEQVMQIVQAVAGFSLGEADILRRAMGKKKADLMAAQRQKFIEGCQTQHIDAKLAGVLFDKIETFAGYGFNKSHSVAYAYVAYQTAFLKANYPVEFMCALLSSESGNLDRTALYANESMRLGIPVLPPDINASDVFFSVCDAPDGRKLAAVRFGLSAIKNVGRDAAKAIVEERRANGPYADVFDLCARVDTRICNRRLLESLNRAGIFVSTGWNRRQVEHVLDDAVAEGQQVQRDRESGQFSLFDMDGMEASASAMRQKPDLVEWPEFEILQWERDMLGLYLSRHPLSSHEESLRRFCSAGLGALSRDDEGQEKIAGGMISQVKIHHTSKGDKMAFLTLDTLEGPVEVTVFSDLYNEKAGILQQDMILFFECRVSVRREPGLVAEKIVPVEEGERHFARAAHVRLYPQDAVPERLERLAEVMGASPGPCDVFLHCEDGRGQESIIHASEACRVKPGRALRYALEEILGEDRVWFSLGEGLPSHRPPAEPRREEPRWKKKRVDA